MAKNEDKEAYEARRERKGRTKAERRVYIVHTVKKKRNQQKIEVNLI